MKQKNVKINRLYNNPGRICRRRAVNESLWSLEGILAIEGYLPLCLGGRVAGGGQCAGLQLARRSVAVAVTTEVGTYVALILAGEVLLCRPSLLAVHILAQRKTTQIALRRAILQRWIGLNGQPLL